MMTNHTVQVLADNVNVFGGTLGADIPKWAKRGRIQVIAPDSDWTFDLFVNGMELARDSGPARCQADNLQQIDWTSPHYEFPITQGATQFDILLDVNVVTAGVGLACIQYEG